MGLVDWYRYYDVSPDERMKMIKHKRLDRLGQNISPTVLMIMAGVLLAVVLFVKPDGLSAKTVDLGKQTGKTIANAMGKDDDEPATPKDEYAAEWYAWVSKDGKTLHCTVDKPDENECLEGKISKNSADSDLLENITSVQSDKIVAETDMGYMFLECESLTDISGLANWDTSNVKDIHGMFRGCSSLTDLTPLSKWGTSNVIDMSYMFFNCESLTDIDALSGWNVSNVTDMNSMFSYCPATPPAWYKG